MSSIWNSIAHPEAQQLRLLEGKPHAGRHIVAPRQALGAQGIGIRHRHRQQTLAALGHHLAITRGRHYRLGRQQ